MIDSIEKVEVYEDFDIKITNYVVLAKFFPDFFPKILSIDSLSNKKVEVHFERMSWNILDFVQKYKDQLTVSDVIEVIIHVSEQLKVIYEKTGVLIRDRNARNIMVNVKNNSQPSAVNLSSLLIQVKQVDLEHIYDAVSGDSRLFLHRNYANTVGSVVKDQKETSRVIYEICLQLAHILKNAFSYFETESESYWNSYDKLMNYIENQKSYAESKAINFSTLSEYFNSLKW